MSVIAEDVVLNANTDHESLVFTELDDLTEILVGGCLVAEALLAGSVRLDDGRRFSGGPRALTADVDPLVVTTVGHVLAMEFRPGRTGPRHR